MCDTSQLQLPVLPQHLTAALVTNMAPSWDDEREANIRRNRQLLLDLNISTSNIVPPRPKPPPKRKAVSKRKAPTPEAKSDEAGVEEPLTKIVRSEDAGTSGLRRSTRTAGKVVDYAGDGDHLENRRTPKIMTEAARKDSIRMEPKIANKRTQNPCVFRDFTLSLRY